MVEIRMSVQLYFCSNNYVTELEENGVPFNETEQPENHF